MSVAEETVREALKQVVDPELFVNIIDLGLVYGVTLAPGATPETAEKSDVKIEMTLTSPACPAGPQLIAQAKDVLGRIEGVGAVEVKLVMAPPWSPDKMSEAAKDQLGIF
jgi:metal-sulfur cluster biosynthetic enzyme